MHEIGSKNKQTPHFFAVNLLTGPSTFAKIVLQGQLDYHKGNKRSKAL
jgi:hypothetical protein